MPKLASRTATFRSIKPGPRAKMAARLYASAAVPTKKAACEAVGLCPQYLSLLSRASVENPAITTIIDDVDKAIHDKTVALSTVIALAARKAVAKVTGLIDSGNEHIALKASADILDRHPETSKTQKHLFAGFSLEGQDAKELASALVRSAALRERFAEVGEGDFIKIPQENAHAEGEKLHNAQGNGGNQASGEHEDDSQTGASETEASEIK